MAETPLYALRGLQKLRVGDDRSRFELNISDLDIPRGKIVAISGPSGCGKSTLLNMLGGLDRADGGEIELRLTEDHAPYTIGRGDFPHTEIGRVFQLGHLLNFASVSVNIALAFEARGVSATRDQILAELERAGLSERHLDKRISQLSGGEQQRVAVARALAGDPALILADEPTSSLDPEIGDAVMTALSEWCVAGHGRRSLVWVTHNIDQLERYADLRLTLTPTSAPLVAAPETQADTGQGAVPSSVRVFPSLSSVPDGAAAAEDRVLDRVDAQIGQPAGDDAAMGQGPRVSTQALRRKAAMGLVFRGTDRDGNLDTLAPLLSINVTWPQRFIQRLARGFSEWSLSTRVLMSALMVLVTATGLTIQRDQADTIINDPETCQVRIGGDTRLTANIVPNTLRALAEQPWLSAARRDAFTTKIEAVDTGDPFTRGDLMAFLSERSDGAGCATAISAWPRDDIDMEAWLPAPDLGCEATARAPQFDATGNPVRFRPYTIEVLSVHRDEPALASMGLVAGTAASVGNALRGQNRAGQRLGIVLSEAFVRFRLELSPDEVLERGRICVRRAQLMQAVEILGISGDLPADHNYVYDAILPLTALDAERRLSDRDDFYSSAILYFEAAELDLVEQFLRPVDANGVVQRLSFRFDPDALSRLADAIGANLATQATFFAVGVLAILVAIYSIGAGAAAVIQTHSAPLAMLLTLGLPKRFVRGIVETYAVVIVALALVVLLPLWLVVYGAMDLALLALPYDLWVAAGLWLILFGILYLATRIAVFHAFKRWSKGVSQRMAATLTMR